MKKIYFIHVFNVLAGINLWEQRATKKGAESLANKWCEKFGDGTVVEIEDCDGITVATYTK